MSQSFHELPTKPERTEAQKTRGFPAPPCVSIIFRQTTVFAPTLNRLLSRRALYCSPTARTGWGRLLQKHAQHDLGRGPRPCPELASPSEGTMTSINVSKTDEETLDGRVDLEGWYREIGISALVAALRYQGDGKNPAYAPREPELRADWFEVDAAA
jgi:hypothetical protein